MLIVSYLSSRQFTGYRISAKLILSSVSKYRECFQTEVGARNQTNETQSPPFLRALHLSSYIPIAARSPRGGLLVLEIIFAMKETNSGESLLLCEFRSNLVLDVFGRVRFIALQNHGVEHRCYIDGALVSATVNPIATPHVPRQRSRIGFL